MGKKRRVFDKAFREAAVRQITDEGRKATDVAKDLGVHPNQLYAWKRQHLEDGPNAFPGHGKQLGEKAEMCRLQKENQRLRNERDILKKAVGIFSKPSSRNMDL